MFREKLKYEKKIKIIKKLTLEYCYLLKNPFLDIKNEADELYRNFGKDVTSENISDYYDFAIKDLKLTQLH